MTEHELIQLERDARRPDYGGRYYKPGVVRALIEEIRQTRLFIIALMVATKTDQPRQFDLFSQADGESPNTQTPS